MQLQNDVSIGFIGRQSDAIFLTVNASGGLFFFQIHLLFEMMVDDKTVNSSFEFNKLLFC